MPGQTQRRIEILFGRFFLNPLIRGLFRIGISPPMTALVETTGRRTGKVRQTPVNYVRDGQTLWIIAQHGSHAGWVRNLEAQPRVRARLGRTWHDGHAALMPDDDVRARIRTFASNPVGRSIVGATFRALETAPVSLRIDLDSAA
ncbi:MAG: nitroreductase family deazaflavin-dependent oxidoreductase [Conexibacter sp.]|nr:nitroreductase family deazaflavin-dependent oxidoreductase [Conexibacter sp.]